MKLHLSHQRNQALTRFEVIIIIAIVVVLALVLMPMNGIPKRRAEQLNCINNMKQISLASRLWEGDGSTNSSYMMINETRTKQLMLGNMAAWFQVMSNELRAPKTLICPADTSHYIVATNFADLHNSNISYFVNPDASEIYPQMILSGDDNLMGNGIPLKSGLCEVATNTVIAWTDARHGHIGNIAYADGSISEVSSSGLQQALVLSTNGVPNPSQRLAIP